MSSKHPPVPPKNRSSKGVGESPVPTQQEERGLRRPPDPEKQGQQGNTKINTTHQGNQQDR